LFASAHTP